VDRSIVKLALDAARAMIDGRADRVEWIAMEHARDHLRRLVGEEWSWAVDELFDTITRTARARESRRAREGASSTDGRASRERGRGREGQRRDKRERGAQGFYGRRRRHKDLSEKGVG
jgi:hypothetical protein